MSLPLRLAATTLFVMLAAAVPCIAQEQESTSAFPNLPGREVFMGKCLQCHGTAMWKDHRTDRKGWEGVLFRMVGRGALWTEQEIRVMADYLVAAYGPQADKK
jgi:hypothetical protein